MNTDIDVTVPLTHNISHPNSAKMILTNKKNYQLLLISPLHTISFERKFEDWKRILEYI